MAPTGHTVRLLELPEAWTKSISEAGAGTGQTCIGPAAAIAEAKAKYERALAALRDSTRTRFVFVLQPEATAIAETRGASAELERLGIETTELIVNGVLPSEEAVTPFFTSRIAMQERYLAEISRQLPMPGRRVPLLDGEVRGLARLRALVPLLRASPTPRPSEGLGFGWMTRSSNSGTDSPVEPCMYRCQRLAGLADRCDPQRDTGPGGPVGAASTKCNPSRPSSEKVSPASGATSITRCGRFHRSN